ncbi:uncharacterized protein LOC117646955 [Thrips palmi]|uniref:Uncharacterized protein LOC117646955 n=1 Tax=Thrips palmi TaxID=161013 RepID=A0A6P8ZAN9_THRPL|nr:uncharacterized protein LOC117646955 [Thrips palmi]
MGVTIQEYRARIGTFICRNKSAGRSGSDHECRSSKFLAHPMSLLLTLILLFMSGIELNPGPTYPCKECPEVSTSAQKYFDHHKTAHVAIPCCFPGCSANFISLGAFQSHLSRNHEPRKDVPQMPSEECPVQDCSISRKGRSFKQHLEDHLDAGHQFVCLYPSCKTVHKKKGSFRTHLSQVHPATSSISTSAGTSSVPQSSSGSTQPASSSTSDVSQPSSVPAQPASVYRVPPNVIKQNVVLFYLELEGHKVLPSDTVQMICQNIAQFTDWSHECLKVILKQELSYAGLEKKKMDMIINKTFRCDPIYNIHHDDQSHERVTTIYIRREEMKDRAPFIPSIEIQLKASLEDKPRYAQYVPLKETLEVLLQDPNVKREFLKSFMRQSNPDVYEDFWDGSAFQEHLASHNHHKCIQILLFQDAFEYSPFGPAKGMYKTAGWYYMLGNLPPQYRSKLDMIMLLYLIQEQYLKPSVQELLDSIDKLDEALSTMIEEFQKLKDPQIEVDGVAYPVCLIVVMGDNLGQHQIGGYIQSFSANYFCRNCPISKQEFQQNPDTCKPFRTVQDYEACVAEAMKKFQELKKKSLSNQAKKREKAQKDLEAGEDVSVPDQPVSNNALKELRAMHHIGVKPLPSPLNKIPGFHVNLAMAPCLAHDLFQGIVGVTLGKILESLEKKKWFDLPTLNRRITTFKCKGQDALDAPAKIRSFDSVTSHACETWTLLRLLPLMLDDLVKDPEDDDWLLYLNLKEICEYVCAPRITRTQIEYLRTLIKEFLVKLKGLYPSCLIPKAHYLCEYPDLIYIFGPLIRLFTLRMESNHVFFKNVAKQCKSFVNITKTLAQKYQYKFACDHINGFLPQDFEYDTTTGEELSEAPPELPPLSNDKKAMSVKTLIVKGTQYEVGMYMLLNKVESIDLSVGCITKILIYPDETVFFTFNVHTARSSGNGYFIINQENFKKQGNNISDLPDYFPLPSYIINNEKCDKIECISLKHSTVFM